MCLIEVIVIGISIKKCITNKQPLTMRNLKTIVLQSMVTTASSPVEFILYQTAFQMVV